MAYHNKNTQYPGNVLEKKLKCEHICICIFKKNVHCLSWFVFFLNLIAFLVEIVSF